MPLVARFFECDALRQVCCGSELAAPPSTEEVRQKMKLQLAVILTLLAAQPLTARSAITFQNITHQRVYFVVMSGAGPCSGKPVRKMYTMRAQRQMTITSPDTLCYVYSFTNPPETAPLDSGEASGTRIVVFDGKQKPTTTTTTQQPPVAAPTVWLHVKQKGRCEYFHVLHEYEAFATTGPNETDPRIAIDEIVLKIRRSKDGVNYEHSCRNTDYCGKSDEITATFGACGDSWVSARGVFHGSMWTTQESHLSF